MSPSEALFTAILSIDSDNRGYNADIEDAFGANDGLGDLSTHSPFNP